MPQKAFKLFENQTANGDSEVFDVDETAREYALVRVYGTFDGAQVQASADFDESGVFCTIKDGLWDDEEDVKQVYLRPGVQFKLTISTAGASTDLNAELL